MGSVAVPSVQLCDYVAQLFEQLGMPPKDAGLVADALVWADLRGMETHGVMRAATYAERIRSGQVIADPAIEIERRRAAVAIVRGGRAQGQVAFDRASHVAVELAATAGIGWVAVVDSTHAGAIGYFTQRIARSGMAALAIGASRPTMPYYGSKGVAIATNPLAMAVPGANDTVLGLDMATATVSRGRLKLHRLRDKPLPEGSAVDEEGRPTTDPHLAWLPTPLGGPKGAGMSLLFECFANVLGGFPLLEPSLSGRLRRHAQGGAVCAIDIGAFRDLSDFEHDVTALTTAIKGLPVAEGVEELLMPGERGERAFQERHRNGITLPTATWDQLVDLGQQLGVAPPSSEPAP